MQKRALGVIGVVAFAGLALPFGLPTGVAAAPLVAYNTINIPPQPIEQPGVLNPSGTNTSSICAQPLNNLHVVGTGVPVFLSIDAGLFTTPSAPGGSATAGSTPVALTSTPQSFNTEATCHWSNQEGSGTVIDAVPIAYTGPNPVPINGRDVIAAESDASSFNPSTGLCTGPGVCNTTTYVFSPVMNYVFSTGSTIAGNGSLAAGAPVTFTVTAEDTSNNPIPGALLDLSLTSSAAGGGTATAITTINGSSHSKPLTGFPTNGRFGATNSNPAGQVSITYTAAATLPSTGIVDTITAQNHPTETVHNATTYTYAGSSTGPTHGPYTAITPFRVCDTRPAGGGIPVNQCNSGSTGAGSGPITQGSARVVTIDGFGSPVVPGDATAVVVNVTAIAPTKGTFVTLYPDGVARPNSSNLNPQSGAVVANLVEVELSAGGKIDVFNAAGTINVALDIEGFVSPSSTGEFNAIAPSRICDTRTSGGGVPLTQCNASGANPINATTPLTFNVHTLTDNVPATGVTAVVFNLTAIAPSQRTVLTAYPSNVTKPNASNVNVNAGVALPNRVIVPVSPSGTVSIANGVGLTNVAVDINGWYGSSGVDFFALTPARICNTQNGNPSDGGQPGCTKALVPAGGILNIDVAGIDGVPIEIGGQPVAVVVNVTAVNATKATFITIYPGPNNSSRPNASDLNVSSNLPVPNLVVVEIGPDGTINLFNALGSTNLIVDVLGYYSS
jgi:hypothetical protein